MIHCFCICPECGEKLLFCPELEHRYDHRPVFRCENENIPRDREYMVLGNIDNFGNCVEDA